MFRNAFHALLGIKITFAVTKKRFWTVQRVVENKVFVLFNGNGIGNGSIASVDVPPYDSNERHEFVKVLYTSAK